MYYYIGGKCPISTTPKPRYFWLLPGHFSGVLWNLPTVSGFVAAGRQSALDLGPSNMTPKIIQSCRQIWQFVQEYAVLVLKQWQTMRFGLSPNKTWGTLENEPKIWGNDGWHRFMRRWGMCPVHQVGKGHLLRFPRKHPWGSWRPYFKVTCVCSSSSQFQLDDVEYIWGCPKMVLPQYRCLENPILKWMIWG